MDGDMRVKLILIFLGIAAFVIGFALVVGALLADMVNQGP